MSGDAATASAVSAQAAVGQGLVINVTYDSSVSGAPAAFTTAVNYAVNYLESVITTPVTLNISVGWGEVGGQTLDQGALGESDTNLVTVTYSQIRAALAANGTSAADATALASLPATDPTNGGPFHISRAEAKALGIVSATSGVMDGAVGFDTTAGTFTFDPNNRAVSGEYDFIGAFEHEITEVMGRAAGDNDYSILDLFRYASSGVRQLGTASPAYFSINGGVTNLDNFNTKSTGDYGDWAASAGNDFFLAFTGPGAADVVTPTDLTVMDVLGWTLAANTSGATVTSVAEQPVTGDLHAGAMVTITLNFAKAVTVTGAPVLSLNDGGTATYASGSGGTALSFTYTVGVHDTNTPSLAVSSIGLNGGTITDTSGSAANLTLTGLTQAGPQIDTTADVLSAAFTAVLRGAPTSAFAANSTIVLADGSSVPNPMFQDAATLGALATNVNAGGTTLAKALATVEHYGDVTTSVATLSYQFFTGATPNSGGYDYLINSAANTNDLNDPYYAKFNEENRYINFAVNLGKLGAGAAGFNAAYGSLDLAGAMTQAYTAIFGFAPASGLIASLLSASVGINETRADYFAAYGLDGPSGIGTKAAAVGWLMAVAVESDLGTYAKANDQFLAALANGTAQYNVNLLTVYDSAGSNQAAVIGSAPSTDHGGLV